MAALAENLHRREITALERAELQARWVEIVGARKGGNEFSRQLGGKPNGGRPEGGVEKAARDLGVPTTNLRRSVKIAKLSPAAKEAAKASGLDRNQSALLKAAKDQSAQDDPIEKRKRAPCCARYCGSM